MAIGDSFTEGVGDPEPSAPGGLRGWADRVAEALAEGRSDFAYANLAVRGKLLDQIAAEQADRALELRPDLVTVSAGGNDLIRPGADPDAVAARFERLIERLRRDDATVVVFTGVDTRFQKVFSTMRGRIAIYNENVRGVAAVHDCIVADQWALRAIQDPKMWAEDRLHLNALGHHEVARMVLDALNVPNGLRPMRPEPARPDRWREARAQDVVWAREHLVPWVLRRIRHVSSGDRVTAKRPVPEPFFPVREAEPGRSGSDQRHTA
ncbi:MAG: SGNH/GDSL hydrolase family protein [Pseudoclavibacter sp.]|nr:SGNH/GDSL hydrolase family protein [Pseudoclavibacter sp.]